MGYRLLGLFQDQAVEEHHRLKSLLGSINSAFDRIRGRFVFFLIVSLSLHSLLLGFLIIRGHPSLLARKESQPKENKALITAISEIKRDLNQASEPERRLSPAREEEILKFLGELFRLDQKFTQEERKDIYRSLINNYLDLTNQKGMESDRAISVDRLVALLKKQKEVGLVSGDKLLVSKSLLSGNPVGLYKVGKRTEDQIRQLREETKTDHAQPSVVNGMVITQTETGVNYVPEEYYFRESPYEDMLAKGASLFSVIKGFPLLEEMPLPQEIERNKANFLKPPSPDKGFIVVFYKKMRRQNREKPSGDLKLSEEQIQQILDRLMALPEEEQLADLREDYLRKYDPDQEDLAKLSREFFYKNLNSVFVITNRFSSAFDFLEELYFKKSIYDSFSDYWKENSKTKTAAEFLFCLASAYDFEKRVLEGLFDAQEDADKAVTGLRDIKDVHNFKLKALVLKQIYEELWPRLRERGYSFKEEVLEKYAQEEVKIYGLIIDLGGEEKNRALWALGKLYWDQGRADLALQTWNRVDNSFPLSSKAYWQIREILEKNDLDYSVLSNSAVNGILKSESISDNQALLERQLKYHKWKRRSEIKEGKESLR